MTGSSGGSLRQDWRLVCTIIGQDWEHELAIVIDSSAPNRFEYYAFNPLQLRMQNNTPKKRVSPVCVVQEHGWFKDVDIFNRVCRTEPIPTHTTTGPPMPQGNLFDAWRSGVLLTLVTNLSSLWVINDGNVV
jgi:hypothetical protein